MSAKLFARIVWETFQWVALFGGVLGLLSGLLLMFNSALFFRIGARMNRWVSTRQAMKPLETPIAVERTVYRYHRFVGALLLLGAAYALYVLVFRYTGPELVVALAKILRLTITPWVAETLRIFLIVVNVFALLIAVVMIVRPSSLKRIEALANWEYSMRRSTRPLEIPRPGPDGLVQSYPFATGAVLTIAGAYVTVVLGYYRLWLS